MTGSPSKGKTFRLVKLTKLFQFWLLIYINYSNNFLTIKLCSVSRGLGQDLVLEPYLYAYDPDFPDSKVIK